MVKSGTRVNPKKNQFNLFDPCYTNEISKTNHINKTIKLNEINNIDFKYKNNDYSRQKWFKIEVKQKQEKEINLIENITSLDTQQNKVVDKDIDSNQLHLNYLSKEETIPRNFKQSHKSRHKINYYSKIKSKNGAVENDKQSKQIKKFFWKETSNFSDKESYDLYYSR
ncbi:unnamed protein product [Brachionus calyciflorus]|uniref:Uncharacterized protein n=1 Tax=Brachionus calyciflorus TaxID=104777 RepID=A0A814E9E4_9BILA|nr:unnamed protein product [Brachionus calyciflorus]